MTAVGKKGKDETPVKAATNEQPQGQSVHLNTANHKASSEEKKKKSKCCWIESQSA